MYKTRLKVNTAVFDTLRKISSQSPKRVEVFVKSLTKDVQRQVEKKVARYPRPAVHPFEFATERSRRWYFWAVNSGKIKTRNGRYVRRHHLEKAWRVKVDRRSRDTFMTLENRAESAVYVYGSGVLITRHRQVPGHRRTGWGKSLDRHVEEISDFVQDRTIDFIFTTWNEELA